MKDIVCIYDKNENYVKRLTSFAIKNYGKNFIYLSFNEYKMLTEYCDNSDVKAIILNQEKIKDINDLKCKKLFILVEEKEDEVLDGDIKYIYKYQNAKKIIEIINDEIKTNNSKMKETKTKIISFYSPYNNKIVKERINKFCKQISKIRKCLVINLDELSNFKGNLGFSNIIYKYKESELNDEYIESQIIEDESFDKIMSVKFPEDFSVITNYELSLIIDMLKLSRYELLIVVCDCSYIKNQYVLAGSDKIILSDSGNKENIRFDTFIRYLEEQNVIDMKKICNINKENDEKKCIDKIIKEISVNA